MSNTKSVIYITIEWMSEWMNEQTVVKVVMNLESFGHGILPRYVEKHFQSNSKDLFCFSFLYSELPMDLVLGF